MHLNESPPQLTRELFWGLSSHLLWSNVFTVKFILALAMPIEKSFISFCKGVLRGKIYL